ncbi:flagellar hook-length control protein FliK [Geomicrobium sp. JCM 19038]|uniref:flagellar hook-length control protein FliK n=1 Tax=Geomicrobium sp. JCM 19038 TaxID=1460635 RepID=UPI00045F4A95|nr:flagellar hook-length control protein FliK [Geomicrobium sp. JCM 19038]GAK07529.1 flagellar hook-length control protein FliK [Geomicrobium sp. JCM 19038]
MIASHLLPQMEIPKQHERVDQKSSDHGTNEQTPFSFEQLLHGIVESRNDHHAEEQGSESLRSPFQPLAYVQENSSERIVMPEQLLQSIEQLLQLVEEHKPLESEQSEENSLELVEHLESLLRNAEQLLQHPDRVVQSVDPFFTNRIEIVAVLERSIRVLEERVETFRRLHTKQSTNVEKNIIRVVERLETVLQTVQAPSNNVTVEEQQPNRSYTFPSVLPGREQHVMSQPELMMQQTQQRLTATEQHVIQLGQHASNRTIEQQFMKQFQSILAKSHLQRNGAAQTLTVQLRPEHLGKMNIALTIHQGQLEATVTTATKAARDIVEAQLPALRQAFVTQQLQVEKVTIEDAQSQHDEEESNEGHATGNERDQEREETEEGTFLSFEEWLRESMNEE